MTCNRVNATREIIQMTLNFALYRVAVKLFGPDILWNRAVLKSTECKWGLGYALVQMRNKQTPVGLGTKEISWWVPKATSQ